MEPRNLYLMEEAIFMSEILFPSVCFYFLINLNQCSGPGSFGSARFLLSESGSAIICGSTDTNPRGKISTKNCRKKVHSQNPNLNYRVAKMYGFYGFFFFLTLQLYGFVFKLYELYGFLSRKIHRFF